MPGFVLRLIAGHGLVHGGRPVLSAPQRISTDLSAEDLCDYLLDPERRLPVFVLTVPDGAGDSQPIIDGNLVARATAGLARLVTVPAENTWILTRRPGKLRSVFGGAVRAYMPGFTETDDPYRHRLFLADRLTSAEKARACETWLRKTAADASISIARLGRDVLEFAAVRTASRRLKSTALEEREAPDAELLETAKQLIDSLEEQLKAKDTEIDAYVEEVESAEARAKVSEQEYRALLYRFRDLATKAAVASAELDERPLPSTWPEFLDWADATYPNRVLFTPSARRMVRAPAFQDVETVARAVRWLATEYYERRVGGGGSVSGVMVEQGMQNALCGGDEYPIYWHGRRYTVDWHIKNGSTRDPIRCLRIYYLWEPDTQQVVIDHLPSHRVTGAT